MYGEPFLFVEPIGVRCPEDDKVFHYVQARLKEINEDRLDGESEAKEEIPLTLMNLPSMEGLHEMEQEHQGVLGEDNNRRTKESYKVELEMLLKDLEEKERECEMIEKRSTQDIQVEDVGTLQELIQAGQTRLATQQREMEQLEQFYLKFNKGEDGGSSSNVNLVMDERLQTIMRKCRMEENNLAIEKKGVEKARSTLNRLKEMKDADPIDRSLQSDSLSVDVEDLSSSTEIEKLKMKLASVKRLEQKLEEKMVWPKAHISFMTLLKKWWIQNKMWNHDLTLLKREERVARAQIEREKKKREEQGKMDGV
jgi:hypothetical protein